MCAMLLFVFWKRAPPLIYLWQIRIEEHSPRQKMSHLHQYPGGKESGQLNDWIVGVQCHNKDIFFKIDTRTDWWTDKCVLGLTPLISGSNRTAYHVITSFYWLINGDLTKVKHAFWTHFSGSTRRDRVVQRHLKHDQSDWCHCAAIFFYQLLWWIYHIEHKQLLIHEINAIIPSIITCMLMSWLYYFLLQTDLSVYRLIQSCRTSSLAWITNLFWWTWTCRSPMQGKGQSCADI